jgi:hypothetical protein
VKNSTHDVNDYVLLPMRMLRDWKECAECKKNECQVNRAVKLGKSCATKNSRQRKNEDLCNSEL